MIWRQDKQSGAALAFTCKQIAGCVKIFINLVPVKSCRPSGKMEDHEDLGMLIAVWHKAIQPKKWRENFPAMKIPLLFMA